MKKKHVILLWIVTIIGISAIVYVCVDTRQYLNKHPNMERYELTIENDTCWLFTENHNKLLKTMSVDSSIKNLIKP